MLHHFRFRTYKSIAFVTGFALMAYELVASLLGALHNAYTTEFPHYRAYPLEDTTLTTRQNIITVYSKNDLAWATRPTLPTARLPIGHAPTDNFAPIEHLHQQCWQ